MDLPPAVVPLCRTGVYENFTWAAAGVAIIPMTAIARMPGCFMGISESEERLLCAAGLTLSIRAIRWLVGRGVGAAYRGAHKLRPAAAAHKLDQFPIKRPPRADSFMRMLDGARSM